MRFATIGLAYGFDMKFGRADILEPKNYSLPEDPPDNASFLQAKKSADGVAVYIGLPKWGKSDLEAFYPRGEKNPLLYYSAQFNAIEFNAFFYRIFKPEQVRKWKENTVDGFKFYPKIPQIISQFRRLRDVDHLVDEFLTSVMEFGEKLGTCFLQMHPTFSPRDFEALKAFVEKWPENVPLAVELRHSDWFIDPQVNAELIDLLMANKVTNIITDTVGRRDLMHMQLTSKTAFIRFTAANDPIDNFRLDQWVLRLKLWSDLGLEQINFFAHIQAEKESPFIPAQFALKWNEITGQEISVPKIITS